MPKLRDSSSIDKSADALSHVMSQWLNAVDPVEMWPTCFTCRKLASDNRTCSKFNAQPPVNVVVKGCESYEDIKPRLDDDIPF